MSEFKECFVESADGLRLYYREYGSQRSTLPVLCLPGLTRNSRDFEAVASVLNRQRRVICPDLRGRGRSDYDANWRSNYNPARYVADTFALLDAAGIERFVALGTSLGGWMTMLMAQQRPDRIAAAILNDIGPELDPDGLARVAKGAGTLERVGTIEAAIEQAKLFYEVAFPDWDESQWRAYTEITYRKTEDGAYDLNFDRNIGEATRAGVSGLTVDPWQLWRDMLGVPTLLIHGEISDILTAGIIDKMRRVKPDLEVATIPGRGHAPLLDETESLHAITQFLFSR